MVQAETGKLSRIAHRGGADAVIYDPTRKLAFIPCGGDGVLEVISPADPAHIALAACPTQQGSRTGSLTLGRTALSDGIEA